MQKKLFVDMDGTTTEWRIIKSENELYEKGYFRTLRPAEPIIDAARKAMESGVDVYILSCVLPDSLYAQAEKMEWLNEHMPFIAPDHMLWVPYGVNKAAFVKEKFELESLSEDDILLDDFSCNLHAWTREHGFAVKVMNGCNGSKGTWKGLRLYADGAAEDLLKVI